MPTWDPSYMICMNSKLPKTKIVTYKQKSGSPDWANPQFDHHNAPSEIESYRVPCPGDSGSGQIFSTQYTDLQTRVEHKKFVLSAVLTTKGKDPFYVKKFFSGRSRTIFPVEPILIVKNTENTSKKCQLAKVQRFRKYSIGLNDKSQRNHI